MSIKAGIIGCGYIGNEHGKALEEVEGIDAVAWCDLDKSRAEELLERYGGDYATDDPEKIFRDDSIDAVYICTLHNTHAPLAVRACEAGKHIMMEKPLALTLGDCETIGEALDRSGVTMMTAFKLRYYPMIRRVREFLPGPIITIAQVMDNHWPDDFWEQDPITGGGNVLSQGGHMLDLLCHLNDADPVSVYADGGTFTHPGSDVIDTVTMSICLSNGRVASFSQSDAGTTPYVSKFSIQLADGVKTVHLYDRLKAGTFYDGRETKTYHDREEQGMVLENREFASALTEGRPATTGYRDGLRATMLILKAFQSIRTGEPQEIVL